MSIDDAVPVLIIHLRRLHWNGRRPWASIFAAIVAISAWIAASGANAQDSPPIPSTRAFDFSDLKLDLPPLVSAPEKHLAAARKLLEAGRWRGAIEEASNAIAMSPDFVEAYRFRGAVYSSNQLYRRAVADFSGVLQNDPSDWEALLNRGYDYCQDRNYERGFADLVAALSLSTTDVQRATAHQWLGLAHDLRDDAALAEAEYRRAIELGLSSDRIFQDHGRALARLGEQDRAIAEFDHSLAMKSSAMTWCLRAQALMALGRSAQAQADYDRAIEAEPKEAGYYLCRGWARLAQGRVDGSIEDFNRSLEIAPKNNTWALASRGWAYLAKHDLGRAIADFSPLLERDGPGRLSFFIGFWKNLSLYAPYDRAVDEFYRRCREHPSLRWALISLRGEEARVRSDEFRYFAAYLVCRTRATPGLAPNLILGVESQWTTRPDVILAALGRAMAAAHLSRWDEVADHLDTAARSSLEALIPGLMRPPLKEFLDLN